MNPFDIFIPILINPLINVLLGLYNVAEWLGLPGPLGWSIIFITLLVNMVVYPLKSAQLRSQKKMFELKPHLAELKKKHGHDAKKHRQEQAALFQKHGYNPAGGCLPLLVQLPVLIGLYNVFFQILGQSPDKAIQHINSVTYHAALRIESLDVSFLGLNLEAVPANSGFPTYLLLIPAITAVLQLVLTKMSAAPTQPKVEKAKEPSFEDALTSSQGTFLYLFPLMTAYFAFILPVGLALYWNVTTVFAIIQQYLIAGPGGLRNWLPKR